MGYETWQELVKVAQPALGAGGVWKVPGETYERPIAVRFTLVTSAAAGSRFPTLDIQDADGTFIARSPMDAAVAASSTATYTFCDTYGSQSLVTAGEGYGPLPRILMPPGYKVVATAVGLLAGDQISTFTIWRERYPTTDWEPSTGATPYNPMY